MCVQAKPFARLACSDSALLNTALLGWHVDCPPAYAALAKACFQVDPRIYMKLKHTP